MGRAIGFIALASLTFLAGGFASAGSKASVKGTEADPAYWISKPTGSDVARYFPTTGEFKGGAILRCTVDAQGGLIGCQVQRNVYSDDGRVLLVERGSHVDGEYRIATVRPGTVRIPVLWTRIRTPLGVVVDIESPGVGPLGASGIDGYVDNRWPERIGAAMLLSVIDDAVKLAIEDRGDKGNGNTVVFPATTSDTGKLAEKVLDSTINIPPLIYQNQGAIVGIYVARDVDFSSVYELKAVER